MSRRWNLLLFVLLCVLRGVSLFVLYVYGVVMKDYGAVAFGLRVVVDARRCVLLMQMPDDAEQRISATCHCQTWAPLLQTRVIVNCPVPWH